jgi:hypothetical protein
VSGRRTVSAGHGRVGNDRPLPIAAEPRPVRPTPKIAARPCDTHPLLRQLELRLLRQLRLVAHDRDQDVHAAPYSWVAAQLRRSLARIGQRVDEGTIDLDEVVRCSDKEREEPARDRVLRLGVFPVAANPLHWGHLLFPLEAIAELGLDRVVLVVQGGDPRKGAALEQTLRHRHQLAREVLVLFEPLLDYSSVARSNVRTGESNLLELIRLNGRRQMEVWYLAGCDHHRCRDDVGRPDTLARLGAVSGHDAFDPARHRLRALFARRGCGIPDPCGVRSPIPVRFLPEVLLASSTAVRRGDLSLAPFAVLQYLRAHPDYARQLGLDRRHLDAGPADCPTARPPLTD